MLTLHQAVNYDREREALQRLIASGTFARSPNLEKILVYLCERYFRGEASHVKEFHLATEVLGRPETFDPKKDSIVRVEIHRLRKRLKDHYEKSPDESVRISLPEKSYAPEFQFAGELVKEIQAPPLEKPQPVETSVVPAASSISIRSAVAGALMLIVIIATGVWLWPANSQTAAKASEGDRSSAAQAAGALKEVATPVPSSPAGPEVRILAGRSNGRYVDRYGNTWEGDRYFTGGEAVTVNAEMRTGGWDANILSGMRAGDFEYAIPLQPGVYELTLLFAETEYGEGRPLGTESRRVFSVLANDRPLLTSLDVLAEAFDPNVAWAKVFRDLSPDPDGKLHLRFLRSSGKNAFVNAILIKPGIKGKLRPIRMVCRPQAFRDANNQLWEPEHYFHGGTQITRPHGAPAGDHVQGERFGYFSYQIPVPKGKYGARLHFWEYWWGPEQPGHGGVGSRIFDVFCNHRPLLVDFDIIKRNPREQTVTETFHGLEPDARNVLVFDFVAKVNFALINAIEIFDESR
jgi:hypothetical protein